MNDFKIDRKVIWQLEVMKQAQQPSEEIISSLYAQALIEYLEYKFQKKSLEMNINETLDKGDKHRFTILAAQYQEFLAKYNNGKELYEKGFYLRLKFD
ncbi:IDEAL domain-containing protein [Bacillus sp. FJAT-45350]|uniref:IDEAL domain-containing protein n=1 Tax=Bacillus sp. FJAT-45350 TaxID=2011014 RepID=UPI0015CD097D|nr:IDEAL domain-containing protein [Bacillus sp. FJAT-45350]